MGMRIPLTRKLLLGNKLAVGGITVAASAIVGTAGMAAAQQMQAPASPTPAAVARCKQDFKQLGFKNVGRCVSAFEHQLHGYGGSTNGSNNTVNTNVTNNVKGDHNVIDTVISYVFS